MMKAVMLSFVVALTLLVPRTVHAQSVYYPGSFWSSTGTLTPVEKDNVISMNHAEQGVAYRGAELFWATTVSTDSKGYDWNRRFMNGIGIRFTQNIGSNGMIRAGVQYERERRYTFDRTMEGLVVSVDSYFGWGKEKK